LKAIVGYLFDSKILIAGARTMMMLKTQGGPVSVGDLFKEVYDEVERSLPSQTEIVIPEKPLVCITPLFADGTGLIHPKIDGQVCL